jgi:diguanylate cyclase (GGDEF)-like protein
LPDGHSGAWLTIFTLETILYAVGTAFIVMLMVKDHHVHVYRTAASTDHLTGLLNRRAFMENAQTLRKRLAKRGESVAVLMFDLDHFKSVNDRFGHSAGDEVLRLFARVTKASTRLDDIIGRFGGEEFIAIVPGDIEVAEKIAERVRTAFENAGAVIENQPIAATVSIGAASSYDAAMTVDALIAKADAALYRAKHEGRNRVVSTESESASERARLIAAARRARPLGLVAFARVSQRNKSARSA